MHQPPNAPPTAACCRRLIGSSGVLLAVVQGLAAAVARADEVAAMTLCLAASQFSYFPGNAHVSVLRVMREYSTHHAQVPVQRVRQQQGVGTFRLDGPPSAAAPSQPTVRSGPVR